MHAKTSQIQMRVTPEQKAELNRRARAAGVPLTAWILDELAPESSQRFRALVQELATGEDPSFTLAALSDLLRPLGAKRLRRTVETVPMGRLDPVRENQLAALVETAAARASVPPPAWVNAVRPLGTPWFATNLTSLRLHLLTHSPPAFRRRNLFVDSTLGDRV